MHPPRPRAGPPIGFAHRGASAERPENTIEAFSYALELGATGLESDAWLTADGEVVLDHDGVSGAPWRRRALSDQPRSEIPGHIPSLADLYRTCGTDFELSLDIKDPAALEPVLDVAEAVAATHRLWLCHPDWRLIASWRPKAGAAKLVESTRLDRIPEGLEARSRILADSGIDAINLHRRDWSTPRAAAAHASGLWAFGWDAQSIEEIRRLVGIGLDGVYSDHVQYLTSELRPPAAPPT